MQKNIKITLLAHSGFVVEFSDIALIFDYYKGRLPESLLEKKLYVFASHFHPDHFQKKIFDWTDDYDVTYILSRDIRFSDSRIGVVQSDSKECEKARLFRVRARQEYSVDELTMKTLRSTDVGVAFFVHIRGLNIYHAGDLNWWKWEEESDQFNFRMERLYKKEIEYLKEEHIDVAFLPLDYRQEKNYALGFDYFMRNTDTDYGIPMHLWGVHKSVDELISNMISEPYREKIVKLVKRGQSICL